MAVPWPSRVTSPLQPSRTGKRENWSCGFTTPTFGSTQWIWRLKLQQYFVISSKCEAFKLFLECSESPSPMYYQRHLSFQCCTAVPIYADNYNEGEILLRGKTNSKTELNLIDDLVHSLHIAAKSFTFAIRTHEQNQIGPQLASAWIGVDVNAWHKHVAYQAAVYALFQTAIGQVKMLCDDHGKDPGPACKILSPRIRILRNHIEFQLNLRDKKLVEWFNLELLPDLAGHFFPLLGECSADYSNSGAAAIILAISCCIAARRLGARRISFPLFTSSLPELVGRLMNSLPVYGRTDTLHHIASRAGFEHEFLSHFGSMANCITRADIIYWMGLVQRKLVLALQREGVSAGLKNSFDSKILGSELAFLGFFALLGRRTRLFLSSMGIKELDEPVKDFLSYLECGGLFVYHELSCIAVYQHFMEVVTEEIGWLTFYSPAPSLRHPEKRRTKQHAIQAEKEIIFSTIFKVCSTAFADFAHFSKSTQQALSPNLVTFLLRSQHLLNVCLEDYWASYDGSSELDINESSIREETLSVVPSDVVGVVIPVAAELHQKLPDLTNLKLTNYLAEPVPVLYKVSSSATTASSNSAKLASITEPQLIHQSWIRRYSDKLISTTLDICLGTRLLFVDISNATGSLLKQVCGQKLTKREKKKLERTLADIASVFPVAVLMLLPVSAVGHAAILAAIKKYTPCLIPSPYSSDRLDVLKQLTRTRKMDVQSLCSVDVISS